MIRHSLTGTLVTGTLSVLITKEEVSAATGKAIRSLLVPMERSQFVFPPSEDWAGGWKCPEEKPKIRTKDEDCLVYGYDPNTHTRYVCECLGRTTNLLLYRT